APFEHLGAVADLYRREHRPSGLGGDREAGARVNGDAVGTGASVLFNSDLSVAVEDALIVDHHMGMGDHEKWASDFGMVPGDGGLALAPLHMPPMMMKEFLMLARPFTAKEFADKGIINYAVPREELD